METDRPARLTRSQWNELSIQFENTPDPDEGSSDTGEHWKLIALLNKFGYYPSTRQQAVRQAQDLLDQGSDEDQF